jgi:two-component system, NarL family, invasion response regulator UvrY
MPSENGRIDINERETNHRASGDGDVRVLIVDDQAAFRVAARAVIERTRGFTLVGETGSGRDAAARVDALLPDLVLMDINMPGVDGIEATRRIKDAHPDILIILLSSYATQDVSPRAHSSGANAYLHKDELSPRTMHSLWQARDDLQIGRNQFPR